MLFLIDNSQGHAAYAEYTLVISQMNIKPGGKQAHMCDSWFVQNEKKITQLMVYPLDHLTDPGIPKGIKAVLAKCGLYQSSLCGKCNADTTIICCNK